MNLSADPTVRRILIVKWSAMGDVAISSAGMEDLHRAFPDARIDLSTAPPWHRLFHDDPRLTEILVQDLRGQRQLATAWRWLRTVAANRYDLIVDLQTTDRSRIMIGLLWLLGGQARYRVGNKRAFPYNVWPRKSAPIRHALDIIGDSLESIGVSAVSTRPVLHCPHERGRLVDETLEQHALSGRNYAVFLPGSQAAGTIKRWGADRFSELARRLLDAGVDKVVLLGGPDEIDECASIALQVGDGVLNLAGRTELLDLVAYCEHACLIVGNDTGTAHVGSSASTPMLIVCGPTDPNRVLPAGSNVQGIQAALPCINCYKKFCSHHTCMAWVTPSMVMRKLEQMRALPGC